jgi:uncharacterized membrane protein
LLAKHAQRVVLIHFPIALFMAGVLFDFFAHSARRRAVQVVAYYHLLGAAASTVPAVATGILALAVPAGGAKTQRRSAHAAWFWVARR